MSFDISGFGIQVRVIALPTFPPALPLPSLLMTQTPLILPVR